MTRKVVIPDKISSVIRALGLSRNLMLYLLNYLHADLPLAYDKIAMQRTEFGFKHRKLVDMDGRRHLFTFTVDDMTSPDHLIVVDLQYAVN